MIRRAQPRDMPQLMVWAEAFLAYHPLTARFPREPRAVEAMLRRMMNDPDAVLMRHDHGAIGGLLVPLWTNPSVKIATELFWWAEHEGWRLMKAFEQWAADRNADIVQMIALVGVPKDVTPVYDRAGYTPVELNFVREVA